MKKQLPAFSDSVRENWVYKVVSLIVAVAIWLTTLHGRKDTIIERSLDIEFILRPGYVTTNMLDKSVRVKVAGSRTQLKRFRETAKAIKVNLAQAEAGERRVEIRPEDIDLPLGVKLMDIDPDHMNLTIKEIK